MYIPSDKVHENINVQFLSCYLTEINKRLLTLVAGCEIVDPTLQAASLPKLSTFFWKSQNNLTREN